MENASDTPLENVWHYPRPPRVERCAQDIKVVVGDLVIAHSDRAKRVLETSHPPVYYIPRVDIQGDVLAPSGRRSFCEWKGVARYWDVVVGARRIENAAWSYSKPTPAFEEIRDFLAFYAELVDECFVDGERVDPQPGNFYGGWITSNIEGPFKGGPGTTGW